MPTYVAPLAVHLGDRVAIDELADPIVGEHLSDLLDGGLKHCRVSDRTITELATAVIPAPAPAPVTEPVDVVVLCTDAADDVSPSRRIVDLQRAAGLETTRCVLVGGAGCANFLVGLDVARGLIASGSAERVLLVTADRITHTSRYLRAGATVLSDGSASCLVTSAPTPGSFEVLGVAGETRCAPADSGHLSEARTALTAIRRVAGRLDARTAGRFKHFVTPHLSVTSRELLAMGVGRRFDGDQGMASDVGHLFAGDQLIGLTNLRHTVEVDDEVLVIATSEQTWWLATLRFVG